MNRDSNEEQAASQELYAELKAGLDDIKSGNTRPFSEVLTDLRKRRETRN